MADTEARFYSELVQAYASHNSQKLTRSVESHTQTFNVVSNLASKSLLLLLSSAGCVYDCVEVHYCEPSCSCSSCSF
jgi:hypothetical protein